MNKVGWDAGRGNVEDSEEGVVKKLEPRGSRKEGGDWRSSGSKTGRMKKLEGGNRKKGSKSVLIDRRRTAPTSILCILERKQRPLDLVIARKEEVHTWRLALLRRKVCM